MNIHRFRSTRKTIKQFLDKLCESMNVKKDAEGPKKSVHRRFLTQIFPLFSGMQKRLIGE